MPSSRPGAEEVSPEEEYSRLASGLEVVRSVWQEAIVSVDTFRAEVARRCVEEWGVSIVNDIGGGTLDPVMWDIPKGFHIMVFLEIPASTGAPVIRNSRRSARRR